MQHESGSGSADFADLGLNSELCEALSKSGYREPTALQEAMVGPILAGHDVLACARRGQGKTLAYLLPLLQQCDLPGDVQIVVVVPTRELALQVTSVAQKIFDSAGLRAVALHPGASVEQQISLLKTPAQLISGTPGRLLDLAEREALNFKSVRFVVIEEMDRLLNSGQLEPVRRLMQELGHGRQCVWVASSVDEEIDLLAARYLVHPERVNFEQVERRLARPAHEVVLASQRSQLTALGERVREHFPAAAIVVTSRRDDAHKVSRALRDADLTVLQMDDEASKLERRGRGGRSRPPRKTAPQESVVWVGSEMITRAIDLRHVGLLAHYGPPAGQEVYVDYVCRLLRLGSKLKSVVTLVEPTQRERMEEIFEPTSLEVAWHEVETPEEPAESQAPPESQADQPPAAEAAPDTQVDQPAQKARQPQLDRSPVPRRYQLRVFSEPGQKGVPNRLPTKTLGSKFRSPRRGLR